MTWETVRLGDVVRFVAGKTPTRSVAGNYGGTIPWVKISDMTQGKITATEEYITEAGLASSRARVLPPNTVLISIFATIGRTAVLKLAATTNQAIVGLLITDDRVDAQFLRRHLDFVAPQLAGISRGVAQNNLNLAILRSVEIPLPPLHEQRRIAAVLDEAEALRATQMRAVRAYTALAEAAFRELEGSLDGKRAVPLDDIAIVASGITKGRKAPTVPLSSVDYMTVANVQDKRLDLSVVKQIDVSAVELERYRLQRGDLLLTEGGDPDKLGRGVVWNEERTDAIHQNHVFRVRLRDPALSPAWLNWEVGSSYGKRYFLRMAKQTTGIATINSTQLRAFPVRIPDAGAVQRFLSSLENVSRVQSAAESRSLELESLFASLQHRAFRGEL